MFGNGSSARPIQPEFFAGFGRHGDKAFTVACVTQTHDVRGGFTDGVFIVRGNVGNQDHFWPLLTRRFGGVTHRFDVTLVHVL